MKPVYLLQALAALALVAACAMTWQTCKRFTQGNIQHRQDTVRARVLEKASIEHKCPLNQIRIVRHYSAIDRYCLNVCGRYRWADETLSRETLKEAEEIDCSWIMEKKP